eukprot:7279995-Pyramimonas_sp.AAC.1
MAQRMQLKGPRKRMRPPAKPGPESRRSRRLSRRARLLQGVWLPSGLRHHRFYRVLSMLSFDKSLAKPPPP